MDNFKKKPVWIKRRLPAGGKYIELCEIIEKYELNTVCKEARCPNIACCWGEGALTFLILGEICTRYCSFCSVKRGTPLKVDLSEPERIRMAVSDMNLKYVLLTSVTRDDLEDGGASHYAKTINELSSSSVNPKIELLIPDFEGNDGAISCIAGSSPEVVGHNIETVPRLYSLYRPKAEYKRSVMLLEKIKKKNEHIVTKSAIILGLGEEYHEIICTMKDLHQSGVDILYIGQYLTPVRGCVSVKKYYTPEEFDSIKCDANSIGFKIVQSGPFVRSSYKAEQSYLNFAQTKAVNPVRELRPLTVCADGGFKPPSAWKSVDHRLKSVVFSNGVNRHN